MAVAAEPPPGPPPGLPPPLEADDDDAPPGPPPGPPPADAIAAPTPPTPPAAAAAPPVAPAAPTPPVAHPAAASVPFGAPPPSPPPYGAWTSGGAFGATPGQPFGVSPGGYFSGAAFGQQDEDQMPSAADLLQRWARGERFTVCRQVPGRREVQVSVHCPEHDTAQAVVVEVAQPPWRLELSHAATGQRFVEVPISLPQGSRVNEDGVRAQWSASRRMLTVRCPVQDDAAAGQAGGTRSALPVANPCVPVAAPAFGSAPPSLPQGAPNSGSGPSPPQRQPAAPQNGTAAAAAGTSPSGAPTAAASAGGSGPSPPQAAPAPPQKAAPAQAQAPQPPQSPQAAPTPAQPQGAPAPAAAPAAAAEGAPETPTASDSVGFSSTKAILAAAAAPPVASASTATPEQLRLVQELVAATPETVGPKLAGLDSVTITKQWNQYQSQLTSFMKGLPPEQQEQVQTWHSTMEVFYEKAAAAAASTPKSVGDHPFVRSLRSTPQPQAAPNRTPRLVFLMIGQSNMAGRGKLTPLDAQQVAGAWKLDAEGRWLPACEPVHPHDSRGQGVGPGMAFAKAVLAEMKDASVMLVPCAVGSTEMREWQPGEMLYETAVERCMSGAKACGGQLAGILWHQGEADASKDVASRQYPGRLRRMIVSLRRDLGVTDLPFVCGELGESFLDGTTYPADRHCAQVNEALRAVGSEVSFSACIEAPTTCLPDRIHFDSAGQREMGQRMAEAWLKIWPYTERCRLMKLELPEGWKREEDETGVTWYIDPEGKKHSTHPRKKELGPATLPPPQPCGANRPSAAAGAGRGGAGTVTDAGKEARESACAKLRELMTSRPNQRNRSRSRRRRSAGRSNRFSDRYARSRSPVRRRRSRDSDERRRRREPTPRRRSADRRVYQTRERDRDGRDRDRDREREHSRDAPRRRGRW
eukprot:TRINITY_DN13737_c0_g1_i1.p1 TRINITY_DN13737_c0_g1~~TRINITY_DN13737_c0_g1_i1.p1  ORF type:complete len:951 (+),score=180.92 TRINITY_DN13737_c0_g1_i1:85-2853(+)